MCGGKSKFLLMASAVLASAFSFNCRMVDNDNDVSSKFPPPAVTVAVQKAKVLAGVNLYLSACGINASTQSSLFILREKLVLFCFKTR